VFSPENAEVSIHFSRLAEIYTGKGFLPGSPNRMNYEEYMGAVNFIQDHFFFINPSADEFTLEKIHEKAKFFVRKYGINALIVDPFATLEHQRDKDSNEQEYYARLLNGMKYFAREQNLHYFLVAHPRKLEDVRQGHRMPTLYDVAGSAHFYNLTDNGFTVWRNFTTGQVVVNIQKVKHKFIGQIGMTYFNFNRTNSSYSETGKFPMVSKIEEQ
jgi:twinkle protein